VTESILAFVGRCLRFNVWYCHFLCCFHCVNCVSAVVLCRPSPKHEMLDGGHSVAGIISVVVNHCVLLCVLSFLLQYFGIADDILFIN